MVTNFLNALDRIPKFMEQYKPQNATIGKDLPTLREIVGGTWKKEEELKKLKTEVAALEREIQMTLTSHKPEAEQGQIDGMNQNIGIRHQSETVKMDYQRKQKYRARK